MGLDGDRGTPRWAGPFPLLPNSGFRSYVLDPGHGARLPLLISPRMGTTVCRSALPTTPEGKYQPARGALVKAGLARNDPRWMKPLPWLSAAGSPAGPRGFFAAGGLALLNVVLPLLIFRLAARRRPWSMRALMALPVAAAVPLVGFLILRRAIESRSEPLFSSATLEFVLGTLAGLPVVVFAAFVVCNLARRRFRMLAVLGWTLLSSLLVGAAWLWVEMQLLPALEQHAWSMFFRASALGSITSGVKALPALEHYDWSGWSLAIIPGAYTAGLLLLIAWMARAAFRAVDSVAMSRGS